LDEVMERAVERVIASMLTNLGEPLTVDDMARTAMFSKFHFSRSFQRITGVSPRRFLSALRLQRAKHLLLSTSFSIADICLRVGYTSVGTFSTRFTQSVGLSPIAYRRMRGRTPEIQTQATTRSSYGAVTGCIEPAEGESDRLTFVGLFEASVPEGRPVSCTIMQRSGDFLLDKVPPGKWYLLAQSVPGDSEDVYASPEPHVDGLMVATHGPIKVPHNEDVVIERDIVLKPARLLDPPVLLALHDNRRAGLQLAANRLAARAVATGAASMMAA